MLGWVDDFEFHGPLTLEMLEVPRVLISAVVIKQSEEGFEKAVRGWSKFGTLSVVEAVYAYVLQVKRGVLGREELLHKLLWILPKATELDILAMQRVLRLGLGITTCDLGLVVLTYTPVRDGPQPQRPTGVIYELKRGESTIYIARNNNGRAIYDGETMCVVPMSNRGDPHPLYDAYIRGFRIITEGTPSENDLCVVHKRLGLRCLALNAR
ncbi:MAG: hypothetical protein QW247_07450 [Pyrobaculum sp.]